MQKRTLARHGHRAGWAHPYSTGPFDPWLYADGGDGDDSGSSGDAGDGDDSGPSDGDDSGDGQTGGDTAAAEDAGRKAAKPAPPKGGKGGEDPAAQVARLTKELEDARKDAGKARTDAKKQAAEEAKASLVQELGKALGLVKDDDKDAAPPDPAKLTAEIERATAAHRQTATELAVFKGASKHGADPDSLTDSRAFMAKLAKLDPGADDFSKKVGEAIKAAVADNPKLKAAGQASAASASGEFTGGTGEPDSNGPQSIDDIRAARRKRRAG
ncbi:hypothetical protein PUR59_04175 [Streptomyces sp. SP18ES09]|uniref:hypothetical protein n=1 Tax=Streptomyces sp. SP18ES09 TaxID=3002532 RepID=UPI002E7A6592|nr:hypothetical protein [Streptomyces sp. SP18ES09]MEE1814217.1 hypothetical protein [Streptomyces sp. SP18ES09]